MQLNFASYGSQRPHVARQSLVKLDLLCNNYACKILLFVCFIPSSRFGVEPGPTAHDLVFVVQRCNSTEFFFIELCRIGANCPERACVVEDC